LLLALFSNLAMVVLLRNVLVRASRPVLSSTTVMGMITTTVAAATTTTTTLHCDDGKKDSSAGIFPKNEDGNIAWNEFVSQVQNGTVFDIAARKAGDKVQAVVETGIPTHLSYGFICGYCSGYTLKKVGKVAAGIFGLGFIFLQTLSYNGYIKIDQERVKESVEGLLDLNHDGKIDEKDTAIAYKKIMKVLSYELPAGSGFVAGFAGGVRSG